MPKSPRRSTAKRVGSTASRRPTGRRKVERAARDKASQSRDVSKNTKGVAPRAAKTTITHDNRRRHARAGVPSTVILFQGHKPLGPCLVENLSEGGLRVVTEKKLARGRIVSVLSDWPGAALSFAQVAHCETRTAREHVVGLAFVDLPRAEEKRLHELVADVLAETEPTVEFIDTDGGVARRLVLSDAAPLTTDAKRAR
jgi:hypothetical protein